MKLKRPISTYIKCDPEAMSQQSIYAVRYAFEDMLADILTLKAAIDILLVSANWPVMHVGECLGDHPEVLERIRSNVAQINGVIA